MFMSVKYNYSETDPTFSCFCYPLMEGNRNTLINNTIEDLKTF